MGKINKFTMGFILGGILLGSSPLLSVSVLFSQAQAQQAALVSVDEVIRSPLSQTTPVLGRLVAQQRSDVAALVKGPVAEISVQIGDVVKQGDALVSIQNSRIRQTRNLQAALIQQARANLSAAKDAQALSEQEYERLKRLKSSAAFSAAKLEDKLLEVAETNSKVAVAEAAVAAAQANYALADIDLERTIIKAPFNGVVTEKYTEAGSYVNTGDPVVSLINYEDLEIEADVPSDRLSGLISGRVVQIELAGYARLDAVVRAVIPDENVLTRTRAVRFTLGVEANILKQLAAGQPAIVHVPIGDVRDVTSVHKDGVMAKDGGYSVYVVEEKKASLRIVTIGDAVGERFEVLSGLSAGDMVVVRGNERLRPDQDVTANTLQ